MTRRGKSKSRFRGDPQAAREADKYDSPIPSREFIMQRMDELGKLLNQDEIAAEFSIESETDSEALRRRLRAMERDGQVLRNRRGGYGLVDRMDMVLGRVSGHPDGFGFLIPDTGDDDLFLAPRQMRGVFHGDRVVARVVGLDKRGRREGAIVEVLERNTQNVVGRIRFESGVSFVTPDNKRIAQDIQIPPNETGGARDSQFVSVAIIEQPNRRSGPVGTCGRSHRRSYGARYGNRCCYSCARFTTGMARCC